LLLADFSATSLCNVAKEACGIKIGYEFRVALRAIATAMAAVVASPVLATVPPAWSAPVKHFHIAGPVYYVGTNGNANAFVDPAALPSLVAASRRLSRRRWPMPERPRRAASR